MTEATSSSHRRQATLRSAGAATHSTEDMSQEVSALLHATDTLQQMRNESEQLIRMALDDSELLVMAREIAQAQGETLDEERLGEALALLKEERFRFQPAQAGSTSLRLAHAWVTRSDWGPRWRLRALTAGAGIALVGGTFMGVGEIREARWESKIEDSMAVEQALQQNISDSLSKAQLDANVPAPVASYVSQARKALTMGTSTLGQIPAVPATAALRESLYEQSPQDARQLLEQRERVLDSVRGNHKEAAAALAKASALGIAYGEAKVFDQSVPQELAGLRDQQRVAFQAAAQQGNPESMQNAAHVLTEAVNLIKVRDALANQANALTEKSRNTIGERLAQATTIIATGDIANGQRMLEESRNLMAQATIGYTLRIVSEPGTKTGVWRIYDNDPNKKTYYIVVDAIDAAGNPVNLPITSVEDKRTETTSRFAVRVPENVFNQIAKDKTEDGIVDNNVMGNKAIGDLEPTYAFPIEGGAITSW